NGENRTHTPKPEWDFKSHASTYSATLALLIIKFKTFLKLDWNYSRFFFICQEYFYIFFKFYIFSLFNKT
ncbi:MAG: hypothetical protein CSA86_06070, partial [Arcobacter sp.]